MKFKIKIIDVVLGISLILWLFSMSFIYYEHYVKNNGKKNSSESAKINDNTLFYSIYLNGEKAGYRTEKFVRQINNLVFIEENVVKFNLSGLSREVFLQSVVSIDSVTLKTKQIRFSIGSGTHENNMTGVIDGDSLKIDLKKEQLSVIRKGAFKVDNNTTFPSVLPFYLNKSPNETTDIMIFDPIIFSSYIVNCSRIQYEKIKEDDNYIETKKYDMVFMGGKTSIWIDKDGRLVKSEGFMFFGGKLGKVSIMRSKNKNVFMLPVEVTTGKDIIDNLSLIPNIPIDNPRNTKFMEVELDGIRAANIDVFSSNKEVVSVNPVIFQIYRNIVIRGEKKKFEMKVAGLDTTIIGTSDYIQPKDGRILKAAKEIVFAETDTLEMAKKINQWIYKNMKKEKDVVITRSVDVLREMKGGCDEYSKLFAALTRSLGIKSQINMGLVYDEGVFRYHSWPSVFVNGVWNAFDPYYGQDGVDATHIALVRGDYDKLIEFLRIAQSISVKVNGYR